MPEEQMVLTGVEGGIGIQGISRPFPEPGAKEAHAPAGSEGFTQVLGDMVNRVNDLQLKADKAVQDFVTGESKGMHEVMIAVEKSNISFQLLSQVRNKAVEAYHEIMRMQV
jgi:flagellar hook-basal body complex protein FliE